VGRRLELAINVSSLLILVTIAVMIRLPHASSAAPARPLYQVGDLLQIPGLHVGKASQTLVLVVSPSCHFCEASMPFYKSLGQARAASSQVQIIAAGPDEVADTRANFASHGVVIDDAIRVSLSDLKVTGTPTAILVDRSGTIIELWRGQLDGQGERSVEAALGLTNAGS
jgi:hypothetical protein